VGLARSAIRVRDMSGSKKLFEGRKAVATMMAILMVASVFAGISFTSETVNAEETQSSITENERQFFENGILTDGFPEGYDNFSGRPWMEEPDPPLNHPLFDETSFLLDITARFPAIDSLHDANQIGTLQQIPEQVPSENEVFSEIRNLTGLNIPHPPIYINGNENFTVANGVTDGNGTKTDPYIIENWNISKPTSGTSTGGIYIGDTTKYFIVRNCYISDFVDFRQFGVYLFNNSYGEVQNCLIENNFYGMILKDRSPTVVGCTISDSGQGSAAGYMTIGLQCINSNATIMDCKVYNNKGGISCSNSAPWLINNTLYNNTQLGVLPIWYGWGLSIPYDSKETIPRMSGNLVSGVNIDGTINPLERAYYLREKNIIIEGREEDCGYSEGYNLSSDCLTEQGIL